VFDEMLLGRADAIHAFDTGAYAKREYFHVLTEDMLLEDFSLGTDIHRPNKLIAGVFGNMSAYYEGDRQKIAAGITSPWESHARAYIDLLTSPGRNEPDDRIASIEVAIHDSVSLRQHVRAVVVPHTYWGARGSDRAPWLEDVQSDGAMIATYEFVSGRPPEHNHVHLEAAVRELYRGWGLSV
jgi:hypothetical protein